MSELMLNEVVKQTIVTSITIGLPILIAVLILGLIISIIQATTQIQEQTLTFLPKLLATAVIGLALGNWMLHKLMDFTTLIFDMVTKIST